MSEITQQPSPAGGGPDGEHGQAPDAEPRCPACGALRPPAVTWCTQCFARFDPPASATAPGPGAGVPSALATGDPDDVAHHPDLGPAEPRRPAGPAPVVPPAEVAERAQELLARLAGEDAIEGRVRSWSGRVQGNGPKVVAMVVGTLVLTGLLIGAMALFGALL